MERLTLMMNGSFKGITKSLVSKTDYYQSEAAENRNHLHIVGIIHDTVILIVHSPRLEDAIIEDPNVFTATGHLAVFRYPLLELCINSVPTVIEQDRTGNWLAATDVQAITRAPTARLQRESCLLELFSLVDNECRTSRTRSNSS